MILLDTDHLTVVADQTHSQHAALAARIHRSGEPTFRTTIVSVEEQRRGWLAFLTKFRDVHGQIPAYDRLAAYIEFLRRWEPVPPDQAAADRFQLLRKQRVRIGTQDLKIASIALTRDVLLLSANLRDFRQVPGLRVENWLV